MPSEERIRGDQSCHFREEFPSKLFPLRREPSTLLVASRHCSSLLVASRRFSSLKRNRVLSPLSVGEMTLRLYGALNYSQNSAHDLRCALDEA